MHAVLAAACQSAIMHMCDCCRSNIVVTVSHTHVNSNIASAKNPSMPAYRNDIDASLVMSSQNKVSHKYMKSALVLLRFGRTGDP